MAQPTQQPGDSDRPASKTPLFADDLFCPECGYSLRGLTSDRCPECGLRLDFIESEVALIPWERRRELGRFRAYWQTVLLATLRTKVFCRAAYRPVSYHDAQAFRWVSVLHVYLPALLALLVVHIAYPDLLPHAADATGWWFVAFTGACVLLGVAALTGVPSYFFQPRFLNTQQQNRTLALSYYGWAPLAWTPLTVLVGLLGALTVGGPQNELKLVIGLVIVSLAGSVVILWIGLMAVARRIIPRPLVTLALLPLVVLASICAAFIVGRAQEDLEPLLPMLACLLGIAEILACWLNLSRVARYTLQRSTRRLAVTWIMPVVWLVVGSLILVGLPAVAYFVAVVFYSLRSGGLGG